MSQHVLVVEDEPEIQASLRSLLEREGYRVTVAGTLADARRAIGRDVDVVLLDWRLPDGEGIDLLRECWRSRSVVIHGVGQPGLGGRRS